MESKKREDAVEDRRDFLKRSAVTAAAAGAVASGNAPDITGPAFGKIRSVSFRSCRLLADDPP